MLDGITDFSGQRPAIDIDAPALTRHVTFRLSKAENPRFNKDIDWKSLLDGLSAHVRAVDGCRTTVRADEITFLPPHVASQQDRHRYSIARSAVVTIADDIDQGFRFRVRVDVYTEMLSLTYIVDRITANIGGGAWADLAALDGKPSLDAERRLEALDRLYLDFWCSGTRPIGAALIDAWCTRPERRGFGHRLADLRGVVIRSRQPPKPWQSGTDEKLAPGLQGFVARHRNGLIARATGRCADDRPRTALAGEPVFCGMLDGDALYIAELGRRNEAGLVEPVRHLLVFDSAPPAQIGRLVRRLHILGEFRHAALMDYDREGTIIARDAAGGQRSLKDLKTVSRDLRELGTKLDQELEAAVSPPPAESIAVIAPLDREPAIALHPPELAGTPDRQKPEPPAEETGLAAIIREVGNLTANADEGGLTYRIEQSRYYARQFAKTVTQLRTVRLRHYQSYNDFVARYVYQLFDRIDRIGTRYDLFLRRLSLLTTLRLSQEIEDYQGKVADALGELRTTVRELRTATDAVSKAAAKQLQAGDDQIDLLSEAASLGYMILVYYVGSAFNHAFEGADPLLPSVAHNWFLAIWYAVLVSVVARFLARVRDIRDRRRRRFEEAAETIGASATRISGPQIEMAIAPASPTSPGEGARERPS